MANNKKGNTNKKPQQTPYQTHYYQTPFPPYSYQSTQPTPPYKEPNYTPYNPNNPQHNQREKEHARKYPFLGSLLAATISFLPVIGPLKDMIEALEKEEYGLAAVNAVFLITDLFIVGYAAKLPFKAALRYLTIEQIEDIFRLGYKAILKLKEAGKKIPEQVEKFYEYLNDLADVIKEIREGGELRQIHKRALEFLAELRIKIMGDIKTAGFLEYFKGNKKLTFEQLKEGVEHIYNLGFAGRGKKVLEALEKGKEISGYTVLFDKSGMWQLNKLLTSAAGDIALEIYNRAILRAIEYFKQNENVLIIFKPAGGDEFYLHILATNPAEAKRASEELIKLVQGYMREEISKVMQLMPAGLAQELAKNIESLFSKFKTYQRELKIVNENGSLKFLGEKGGNIRSIEEYLGEQEYKELMSILLKGRQGEKVVKFFDNFRKRLLNVEPISLGLKTAEEAKNMLKNGSATIIKFELIIPENLKPYFQELTKAAEKGYSVEVGRAGPSVFNLLGHDVCNGIRDLYIKALREAAENLGITLEISAIEGKGPFTLLVNLSEQQRGELLKKAKNIFEEGLKSVVGGGYSLSYKTAKSFDDLDSTKSLYDKLMNSIDSQQQLFKKQLRDWAAQLNIVGERAQEQALRIVFDAALMLTKMHFDEFMKVINKPGLSGPLKNAIFEFAKDPRARSIEDFQYILEKHGSNIEYFLKLLSTREVSALIIKYIREGEKEQQPQKQQTAQYQSRLPKTP